MSDEPLIHVPLDLDELTALVDSLQFYLVDHDWRGEEFFPLIERLQRCYAELARLSNREN